MSMLSTEHQHHHKPDASVATDSRQSDNNIPTIGYISAENLSLRARPWGKVSTIEPVSLASVNFDAKQR